MAHRWFEEVELAKFYSQYRPGPEGVEKEILTFLSQRLSQVPYSCAVDVGCGTGALTRALAPHFIRVVGVDVSQAQIQVARETTKEANVEYTVGAAEDMSFLNDECAELVTTASAFHFFDTNRFFREVNRVLKPGGCLALLYPIDPPSETYDVIADVENANVIQKCSSLLNDFMRFCISCQPKDVSEKLFARPYVPPGYTESHSFLKTCRRQGDIDMVEGFLKTIGTTRKFTQENPERDVVSIYKQRLLGILREASSSPETVQMTLLVKLECTIHVKPL